MPTYPACRLVALWGAEHLTLGKIATAQLEPCAAIALSRGRYPKSYEYVDPNEDAAMAATAHGRWLLAVADGHNGFDAARAAQEAVAASAERLLSEVGRSPADALHEVFARARAAVAAAIKGLEGVRQSSGTALSVALIDERRVHAATLGDTVVVRVRGNRVIDLTRAGPFLGPSSGLPAPRSRRLRSGDRVILATDGMVDFLGRDWRRRTADTAGSNSPYWVATRLTAEAGAGGAGDNVAVAVFG